MDGSCLLYHKKWIGTNQEDHKRLHALIHLIRLPILLFISMMNDEHVIYSLEGIFGASLVTIFFIPIIAIAIGFADFNIFKLFTSE